MFPSDKRVSALSCPIGYLPGRKVLCRLCPACWTHPRAKRTVKLSMRHYFYRRLCSYLFMNNNLVHSIYEGTHIITCINSKRTKKYTTDTNRFIKLHYRKCAHNCVIETDKIWKKLRFQTLIRLLSFFVEQTFPAKTSETVSPWKTFKSAPRSVPISRDLQIRRLASFL